MTLIETAVLALPATITVGLAVLVRSCGTLAAGIAGAGAIASAMIFSAKVPKVIYYDRGPLNAAGVDSAPFAEGILLATLAVLFFDGAGVPHWVYLPAAALTSTCWFLSQSWVA